MAALLWLPVEDTKLAVVLAFAFAISTWWGIRLILSLESGRPGFVWRTALRGAVCGLAIAPLAALLMVFKSGLHAHGSPDFSVDQMVMVFKYLPVWIFSGVFLALGAAFLRLARQAG